MRTAGEVRNDLREIAKMDFVSPSSGIIGAMIGIMNEYLGGDDYRRLVAAYLFSEGKIKPLSSRSLTPGQVIALLQWVKPAHDETSNKWVSDGDFRYEAITVLSAAITAAAWVFADGEEVPPIVAEAIRMGYRLTDIHDNDDPIL